MIGGRFYEVFNKELINIGMLSKAMLGSPVEALPEGPGGPGEAPGSRREARSGGPGGPGKPQPALSMCKTGRRGGPSILMTGT